MYVDSYLINLETGDNMPAVPKLKKRRLSKNAETRSYPCETANLGMTIKAPIKPYSFTDLQNNASLAL